MTKNAAVAMLVLIAFAWTSAASAGKLDQMVGKWNWEGFTIKVTKSKPHGVSAKVVKGPKNVGMEMIQSKLKPKGDAIVARVKHPGNGKVYNAKISKNGSDSWMLDGCTDGGACASGVFTRVE